MSIQLKKYLLLMLTVLLATTLLGCTLGEEHETVEYGERKFYSINPGTLLDTLMLGKQDAFSLLETNPTDIPAAQQKAVSWKSREYILVVEAIYKSVWEDTMENWSLNRINFSLDCENTESGFQDGEFEFFRVMQTEKGEVRQVRQIDIDPRNRTVSVWEKEYSPRLVDWPTINLENVKISAEDALRIAESEGGKEKRLSLNNLCHVDLSLNPSRARYKGWYVDYRTTGDLKEFYSIDIDPSTGKKR